MTFVLFRLNLNRYFRAEMFGLIRHKIKRPLALMLAAILVLLSLNNSYFMHAHRMADGSIVYHAHPFDTKSDSAPVKSHHHSIVEIVILDSLVFFIFILGLGLIAFFIERRTTYLARSVRILRQDCYIHLNGRAPPTNFISSLA